MSSWFKSRKSPAELVKALTEAVEAAGLPVASAGKKETKQAGKVGLGV